MAEHEQTFEIEPRTASRFRMTTGSWTVIGMFSFGIVMVLTLYLYWDAYTKPFRELQYAIAARFPDSSPRVIGGKHKSHKEVNPNTFRMVVRVPLTDFDPTQDEARSQERALILAKMANELQDLSFYEVMEIHLIQRVPEQETKQWSVSQSINEWQMALKQQVTPAEVVTPE